MIQGIEHTAIASADIEKLAQWYVATLGFEINYQSANAIFVKTPNRTMIEMIRAEGDRPAGSMKTPGLRHLALTVTDFEPAYEKLKAAGVKFLTGPEVKGGNKVVFFEDPEGNILHLLERAVPLP